MYISKYSDKLEEIYLSRTEYCNIQYQFSYEYIVYLFVVAGVA